LPPTISGFDLRYRSQNSDIGSDFKAYPVLATYNIRDVPDVVADIRADNSLISGTISGYTDIVADIRADIGDNIRIY
jgi:hypothetical protein